MTQAYPKQGKTMLKTTKQMIDQHRLKLKIRERFTVYMGTRRLSWLLRWLGVEEMLFVAFGVGFCDGGVWEGDCRDEDEKRIYGKTIHE